MAATLSPSSIISRSLLCSASSSTSLRCALLSPVPGGFGGVPQRLVLNSETSSPNRRRRPEGPLRREALNNESTFIDPQPDVALLKIKLLVINKPTIYVTKPSKKTLSNRIYDWCYSNPFLYIFISHFVSKGVGMQSVVSGLNRGLAANEEDLRIADSAAKELVATGGPVILNKYLDKLQGKWKLIYSSAFSSRSLGGSRPGPPTGRLIPITLGQVFQRIDILSKDFDNIVELQFSTPWPLPQIEATATLAHKFELIGTSNIKITFEKTTVKPSGNISQLPPLEIPRLPDALRPPSSTGSGEFEVVYLDSDLRITRGDRGELRVFVIT